MKTYIGGRGTGKTYHLFERARAKKLPIITFRECAFRNLVNYAHSLGFDDIEIRYVNLDHAIKYYDVDENSDIPFCDCLMNDYNEELQYMVKMLTGYNIITGVVCIDDGQVNFGGYTQHNAPDMEDEKWPM
jgi:hypothetical protein